MTIHIITISGGSYEDRYEHNYYFSTKEKALEFAKSYVNSDSGDWCWEKYESAGYQEIELDTNDRDKLLYILFDGNKYAPTDKSAEEITLVSSDEYYSKE